MHYPSYPSWLFHPNYETDLISILEFRLCLQGNRRISVNVDPDSGCLHRMKVGCVSDVSEEHLQVYVSPMYAWRDAWELQQQKFNVILKN
jgi:hypothetical protein